MPPTDPCPLAPKIGSKQRDYWRDITSSARYWTGAAQEAFKRAKERDVAKHVLRDMWLNMFFERYGQTCSSVLQQKFSHLQLWLVSVSRHRNTVTRIHTRSGQAHSSTSTEALRSLCRTGSLESRLLDLNDSNTPSEDHRVPFILDPTTLQPPSHPLTEQPRHFVVKSGQTWIGQTLPTEPSFTPRIR